MKKFLSIALMAVAVLIGCAGKSSQSQPPVPKEIKGTYYYDGHAGKYYQHIGAVDLSKYNGKTVQSMTYCNGCATSGDYLILKFTDNTQIKVYAYKYEMQVHY